MPKPYIPAQRGTANDKFRIGDVDIDASVAVSPWSFVLPPTPGTSGYVLTTDGSGILSWTAVGAASDSTTPYYIPVGETFTNNINRQNLFSATIVVDGTLEVDGLLINV